MTVATRYSLKDILLPNTFRGRKPTRDTEVRRGRVHERDVYQVFEDIGLDIIPYRQITSKKMSKLKLSRQEKKELRGWYYTNLSPIERQCFTGVVYNYPYINPITDRAGRTEFMIVVNGEAVCRIECRSQTVNGSVDKKNECEGSRVQNNDYPESKFAMVVDGDYYTDKLIGQVDSYLRRRSSGKDTFAGRIPEFTEWLNSWLNRF